MPRISLTDLPWLPFRGSLSIGPITTPTIDDIKTSLFLFAERFPNNPLVCGIDVAQRRWRPIPRGDLDDHLGAVVVAGGEVDAASIEHQLPLWLADFHPSLPLKIHVGSRGLTMLTSHALGDGRMDFALLERLLKSGRNPAAILELAGPTSDRTTVKALVDFYGRQPSHMLDTWRSSRPAPNNTAGLAEKTGPAPRSRFVYSRLDRPTWSAIRTWRNERLPDVSVAAVLFSLICRAFATTTLGIDTTGFYMLVDNRRYLKGPAPLSGNLAKSVYIQPEDLGDPVAIQRSIRATVGSGRTLAGTALSSLSSERHRRRQQRTGQATGWAPSGDVVLSLSYLSQMESFESLPWLGGDGECWLAGSATTGSPNGITVFGADVRGELHLSTSFVPGGVDEAGVRMAIAALQAGPLASL